MLKLKSEKNRKMKNIIKQNFILKAHNLPIEPTND